MAALSDANGEPWMIHAMVTLDLEAQHELLTIGAELFCAIGVSLPAPAARSST